MNQVLSKYEEEMALGKKYEQNTVFTVTLYQTLLDNTEKWKKNVHREANFWCLIYNAHLNNYLINIYSSILQKLISKNKKA